MFCYCYPFSIRSTVCIKRIIRISTSARLTTSIAVSIGMDIGFCFSCEISISSDIRLSIGIQSTSSILAVIFIFLS